MKLEGNKAFAQHDWPTAVEFYTKAIEKYDREPSFFCNRAQVTSLPVIAAQSPFPEAFLPSRRGDWIAAYSKSR